MIPNVLIVWTTYYVIGMKAQTERYCTPSGHYGECKSGTYCYDSCCTEYELHLALYDIKTNYTWCSSYSGTVPSYYCADKRIDPSVRCYPTWECYADEVYCNHDCYHPGQCKNGTYVCDSRQCTPAPTFHDYSHDDDDTYNHKLQWMLIPVVVIAIVCIVIVIIIRAQNMKKARQFPHVAQQPLRREEECADNINIVGIVHSVSVIYQDKAQQNNVANDAENVNQNYQEMNNEGGEGIEGA
eukprot:194184_1